MSVQEEMVDTSARDPHGLALALVLVRCAISDLVEMKGFMQYLWIRWREGNATSFFVQIDDTIFDVSGWGDL